MAQVANKIRIVYLYIFLIKTENNQFKIIFLVFSFSVTRNFRNAFKLHFFNARLLVND